MVWSTSSVLFVTSIMFVALIPTPLVSTVGATQAGPLDRVARDIERRIERSPGTPLADKLEDALAKVKAARDKLEQARPDRQGALGELEGAAGDLDAAVSNGRQPGGAGVELMDRIAGAARQLARDAIDDAAARRGNSSKVAGAGLALARGDDRRRARGFKDAVAAYKDAASKAEGA